MVFQLPPINTDTINKYPKLDKTIYKGEPITYPDLKPIQDDLIHKKKEEYIKIKDFHIFNLPMEIFFQNMANTIILILNDLVKIENYSNYKIFMNIFLKEDRLFYIGIFFIIITIFIKMFFD